LIFLAAEGTHFALVETSSGVAGYVQAKYIVEADHSRDDVIVPNPVEGRDVTVEMTVVAPVCTTKHKRKKKTPKASTAADPAAGVGMKTSAAALACGISEEVSVPIENLVSQAGPPTLPPRRPLPPTPTIEPSPHHFPRHLHSPTLSSTPTHPSPIQPTKIVSSHYMLWDNDETRNHFLIFFSAYVIWAAFDIAFDILFAVESSRILLVELPDFIPLRHFFPATVACLGSSMLLTMYANIPVLRRAVLVSRAQHDEDSQGNSKLAWEEFLPAVATVFRVFIVQPVSDVKRGTDHSCFGMFLFSGPSNVAKSFSHLGSCVLVILRNVICFCMMSMSGRWEQFDLLDDASLYPSEIANFSKNIVDSCEGGVCVEFCHSSDVNVGEDGYLSFLSLHVVRPIGSLFNFKTPENPTADIDISDPLNAGYLKRVMMWWNNYDDWEEQPALSFFAYLPLITLLIVLPTLQIVSSLTVAIYHFISMILQLVLLPVLVGLGMHSGPFISFCHVVKYATGAICILSDSKKGLPCLKIVNGTSDLSRYSTNCRGINSLHALHTTAHIIQTKHSRFKFSSVFFGAFFFPLRALVLTLVSVFVCLPFSHSVKCVYYLCLGIIQICSFVFFMSMCSGAFLIACLALSSWFFVTMVAMAGMELLCFISAMTNPEVGLILYDNVDERRYRLGAAAGFLEDFPGFILQAHYTHLMGVRGSAGVSRVVSLTLSSWRMFVLTVQRLIKLKKIASSKAAARTSTNNSWDKEHEILKNSNGVVTKILFNFRSSLFPDQFSAVLRVVVFGMYAGLVGWLASLNLHTHTGFSAFLDSNFPVPTNICPQQSTFVLCDFNAHCHSGECKCDVGFGGDGFACKPSRPGSCDSVVTQCNYPAICQNLPGGGFTCPCPSWTTAPASGVAFSGANDTCLCPVALFPISSMTKKTCTSRTKLSQGDVAAIMICGVIIPFLIFFGVLWKYAVRKRMWLAWLIVGFVAAFSLTLGLVLGLKGASSPQLDSIIISSHDRKSGKRVVSLTINFTPSMPVPPGGTITLSYPSGFFAPSITPTVAAGSSSVAGLTGTCSATTSTSVVITTAGAVIPASAFVLTVSGFSIGMIRIQSGSVVVRTSADMLGSEPISSGFIDHALLNLTGHSNWVRSVAWSPDGTKIATASDDNTARVWSSSSGSTLLTLTGHSSGVWSVAWSPDGTKIATASIDNTARVWSSSSGSTLLTLTGHNSGVYSVAWSPDGTKIATASHDGTERVWSSSSGSTLLFTLTGYVGMYVMSLAWSPDGTKIATTASYDRTARVWSSSSGSTLLTLTGHSRSVWSVAWSPDGTKIATASADRTARVWSSSSGSTLLTLTGHSSDVLSVAWSLAGTGIATASADNTARADLIS
jgi:hypothetical protein